jgi:signal transduction histidine kinase
MKPTQLTADMHDAEGKVEGWFRIKVVVDSAFGQFGLNLSSDRWAATDIFIDGVEVCKFGETGNPFQAYNNILKDPCPIVFSPEAEHILAMHFVFYETAFTPRDHRLNPKNLKNMLNLNKEIYKNYVITLRKNSLIYGTMTIAISFLLCFLFWLFVFLNPGQKLFRFIAILTTFVFLAAAGSFVNKFFEVTFTQEKIIFIITNGLFLPFMTTITLLITEYVLQGKNSNFVMYVILLMPLASITAHLYNISLPFGVLNTAMNVYLIYLLFTYRKNISGALWAVVMAMILPTIGGIIYVTLHKIDYENFAVYELPLLTSTLLSAPFFLVIYVSFRFRDILSDMEEETKKVLQISEEKKEILKSQNETLEREVEKRTTELKKSMANLKSTQAQLIQSEKMASLGELTAGIAHEIQNPLNFVNNFSELSVDLAKELKEEVVKAEIDKDLIIDLATDLSSNQEKINHHGKRASSIVKGMLEHSRKSSGTKEPADINTLTDEYLRLAYHGLRAKDKDFNATMETHFDPTLPKIDVISQDIGRVLLNLITNAFYAVNERSKKGEEGYQPTVSITTKRVDSPLGVEGERGKVEFIQIAISDNGTGIPDAIKDKIFQPFFTTKPTGQGTGLGLSLAYDIVTKGHGGTIEVEITKGVGTTFIVTLSI